MVIKRIFIIICFSILFSSCNIFFQNRQDNFTIGSRLVEYSVFKTNNENIIIAGKVFDLGTKEPLPFVDIEFKNLLKTYNYKTDIQGQFIIEKVLSGLYKIRFKYIGYKELSLDSIDIYHGNIIYMKIELENMNITLD